MNISDFKLERYFAKHEFSAKYLLSSSDCDGVSVSSVLSFADNEELRQWNNLTLGYTESAGSSSLREQIAAHYSTIGVDDIVVASPGELNFITMNLLVGKGDHAVVISPSYQSLYEVIRSVGCDISFWGPNENDGEACSQIWNYSVEALERLIRPNTKLIVINFPHNPTGSYISKNELDAIVEVAKRHDIWLFSDEMYRGLLIEEGLEQLPAVCDIYDKGISLWGMAKSFALAGLRIGWIATHQRDFLLKVVSFKDYLSICNSAPSEVLASIALHHCDNFISSNISKIKTNIALFSEFVKNGKSSVSKLFLPFAPPRAGSVAFVPIRYEGTSLQFSDMLVEKYGIMTVPAEMFDYQGNYLRIGFGRENLREVLTLLNTI